MRNIATVIAIMLSFAHPSFSDNISLTGSLDPNNPDDVFLYSFTLASASSFNIQSYGYGGSSNAPGGTNAAGTVIPAGGFDTYFSVFFGLGPGATFLASNDDGLCPPGAANPACLDSTLHFNSLAAGSYTFALTLTNNFSFAENFGSGTLGDGFIGLADYYDFVSNTTRTSNYAVDITSSGRINAAPVPEPASAVLVASVFILLALAWGFKNEGKSR
jgi:hypothetical protein